MPGTPFKTRMRIERAVRMEALGFADQDIALAIGVDIPAVRAMRTTDIYKQLRIQVSSGILTSLDEVVGEETDTLRERLRAHVPLAMQAIVDTLEQKTDPKLRFQAAEAVLDRDGRFMKASRTVHNTQDDTPLYMNEKDDEQIARIMGAQVKKKESIQ